MEHPMNSANGSVFAETTSSGELQYMIVQNYIQERGHTKEKIQTETNMQIVEDQLHLQNSCPTESCEE